MSLESFEGNALPYVIEPMQPEDIFECLHLELQGGLHPWMVSDYLQLLQESSLWMALIARSRQTGPSIVGTSLARYPGREMELCKIAVKPEFRGKRVGSHLLRELLLQGRIKGCEMCFLEVRFSNQVAIRFYEQHGFLRIGKRPGYYSDPIEDALLMGLEL